MKQFLQIAALLPAFAAFAVAGDDSGRRGARDGGGREPAPTFHTGIPEPRRPCPHDEDIDAPS